MIGRLNGVVLELRPPQVLLEVAGVGYEVDVPISDCAKFETLNSSITLYTHLVIREDAHSLFGFLTVQSRDSFRSLIKVSGVGPRIALALLSTLSFIVIDVRNALSSLGYNDKEISSVMKQLPDTITDLSSGIREALKLLNKF